MILETYKGEKMEINFEKLKKSINQVISSILLNKDEFSKYKCLVNIPAKRLDPTFLIYFLFNPKNFYLILSEELESNFINSYISFCKFFKEEIYKELNEELKYQYKDFSLELEKLNVNIMNNNDFSDFQIFKRKLESILQDIIKNFNHDQVILDITGGKKLHSVISAELSKQYHISFSYLDVTEAQNKDGLTAVSGTEKIYIQPFNSKRLSYLSISSFPIISISDTQISCFYNGNTFNSKFSLDEKIKNDINNLFIEYSKNLPPFLSKNLHNMLEPDFLKIKEKIRNLFSQEFISNLEDALSSSKVLGISLDERHWNFPFEFIFRSHKDFIILRSIPFVNEFINSKNDKNSIKNKILIACLSNDDLMKKQYEDLKENLENLAGITIKELFLPSKEEFLNEFSESTMTHIICHGKIVDNKQILVLENSNEKIFLRKEDFTKIRSSDFVFISSCSSLTINVNWEDTIYKEMVKNGCKTIIGTHWAIPQNLSLSVSTSFYKNFTSGKPVGMALHEALKEINDEFLSRNFYFIGNHTLTLE